MARFDVDPNPYPPERGDMPFVFDVQNDHLGPLGTRFVIPLRSVNGFATPARGLNLQIDVDGKPVIVDRWRDDVQDALDTLFGAY